jgi:hypothetical protein
VANAACGNLEQDFALLRRGHRGFVCESEVRVARSINASEHGVLRHDTKGKGVLFGKRGSEC